tara:strand:- start:23 stop:157 length:135 start_codon:yes stop_codon:yes gene_type:complete
MDERPDGIQMIPTGVELNLKRTFLELRLKHSAKGMIFSIAVLFS